MRILDQAHLVDQRSHVLHTLGRADAGARLGAHRVQPAHGARVPSGVGPDRVVERRLVAEQSRDFCIQFGDRVTLVEAEALLRALRPAAKAVPGFALFVLLAAEQQAPGLRAGDDHQHGLGLREAGEVVEMAVEAVGVVRVAVAYALRRGRNDRHAALHRLREAGAARAMECGIESVRFHGFFRRASSADRRSGVPTSLQCPSYSSPVTSPRSAAARHSGARGAFWPAATPATSCGEITAMPA